MANHTRGKRARHNGSDFRPPHGHPASYEPKDGSGPSVLTKVADQAVVRAHFAEETVSTHGPAGRAALNPTSTLRKSLTNQLHLKVFPQDKEFSNPQETDSFRNPLTTSRQLVKADAGSPLTTTIDVKVRKQIDPVRPNLGTEVVTERYPLPGSMTTVSNAKLMWQSDRDLLSHQKGFGDIPLTELKRETAYTKERKRDVTNFPIPANLGPGMVITTTAITTDEGFTIPNSPTPEDSTTFERCEHCYRTKETRKPCMCGHINRKPSYNPIP